MVKINDVSIDRHQNVAGIRRRINKMIKTSNGYDREVTGMVRVIKKLIKNN